MHYSFRLIIYFFRAWQKSVFIHCYAESGNCI